jgi:hypothetical protein
MLNTCQKLAAMSLGFLGAALFVHQAQAATAQCGPRAQIITVLTERFGEAPQSTGLAGTGAIMELFANAETGSWSFVLTLTDGRSCLMASGEGYDHAPAKTAHGAAL